MIPPAVILSSSSCRLCSREFGGDIVEVRGSFRYWVRGKICCTVEIRRELYNYLLWEVVTGYRFFALGGVLAIGERCSRPGVARECGRRLYRVKRDDLGEYEGGF